MPAALLIQVAFPRAAYSGGDLGVPEELPSPARVHAAFASAAGGGPYAEADGRVLVATERHRAAVRWLEEQRPLAVLAPETRANVYAATRFRFRARTTAPEATAFEPFTSLAAAVVYAWPTPDSSIVDDLAELAAEVTHIGRVESDAIVRVEAGSFDAQTPGTLLIQEGRGPGRAFRIATAGRLEVLEGVHRAALRPGRHGAGSKGKQAVDEPAPSAGEQSTRLTRFAEQEDASAWPFAEVWRVELDGPLPRWATTVQRRVAVAVAAHRAIVAAIGTDVPGFVTGRDGDGPLRGAGHLAIHASVGDHGRGLALLLAIPVGVPDADRAALLQALRRRPRLRLGAATLRIAEVVTGSARPFWPADGPTMASVVPIVLDAPGPPRKGRWTLDDAVICSVGYAARGMLEGGGLEWGTGWAFRQDLVAGLRRRGVDARARRIGASPAPFVHRARAGDLLVAVEAAVTLGDLAETHRGFLALGRARHLGGGLLQPAGRA